MRDTVEGIAIVGMAGRFPGADSVASWWEGLLAGRESLTRFEAGDLSPWVPTEQRQHPRYVPVRGVMADADRFDAAFFGVSAREARLMDPQQRVFLELCWNALEDAGIDTMRYPGTVGVYAGTSNNHYRQLLDTQPGLLRAAGEFAIMLANEKDYVATRVAHRLNLTGPALSIHTACSTSLVAVVQAWYALMSWQCDLALAGGINIVVPQESGYVPVEGGMQSADGHCRPFDALANGTVFSSGGAVVVLKRLQDAIADRDTVYAVIRGVGVNNDGGDKASFSAPSVRGQAAAIRQALSSADVDAGSIGYVEAHGTGTSLGDPIEVEALTRAFREDTDAVQFCRLGSAKSNMGHLNAASGVSGLIKAALSLYHGRIPATLHYKQPNPDIDFVHSPFRVVNKAVDWPRGDAPRRAGVSSFGVGGTNAHVVLEEAPLPESASGTRQRPFVLLPLSARDEAALQRRVTDLVEALQGRPDAALPDIGYTLATGRRSMPVRTAVVAGTTEDARERLGHVAQSALENAPKVVFMFPGQGSQHANMARELLRSEPVFREAFERCCALSSEYLDRDLRSLVLPGRGGEKAANSALAETRYTQPALFAVEYALAELWTSWGIQPVAMIGHSIGEYVAATRAGVFGLEDAVKLVIARGAAMFAQPPGAMLAVRTGAAGLTGRLPVGVEISGYNTPSLTIVSGSHEAIDQFADSLERDGIANTRLRVSHAFHSALMDGALAPFREAFDGVQMHAPGQVFYSCVSGTPIQAGEATSVDYWCRQIRQPVRFADALQHSGEHGRMLYLELGPSQALTGLARTMLGKECAAQSALGPAAKPGDAAEMVTRALGACWCRGVEPDWNIYFEGQERRHVPLPGYPFHGERYWVEPVGEVHCPAVPGDVTMQEQNVSTAAPAASAPARAIRLAAELRELFENLSGERIGAEHDDASFLDLGFDSLALTQAALEIERSYGLKLKFRRLLEDLDSVGKLAAMLDSELPPETAPSDAAPAADPAAVSDAVAAIPAAPAGAGNPALAQLIQSQMALMAQQTELLRALASGAPAGAAVAAPTSVPAPMAALGKNVAASLPANLEERPFGAAARIARRRHSELDTRQLGWLRDFVVRYTARTTKSRDFSQTNRGLMADPRVVTGFDPRWKELVYPIVVVRSAGARMWDLDGNEYIDLLNSFGVNFLGYQPGYIKSALLEQINEGYEIGPQHPLTAEVSQLISDMTGMPRVAFCNTGSEAVMGAMRIARTVTGRETIVIFKDSYHGIFDEVIVHGTRNLRSIAAAPGILANAVENVLVLEYGSDEALRVIRERASELAAVMIEPIQGRNPTLQPHAFVHELRTICDEGGCALIFDEVITGFRVAQGGAQEFYGVRADIATYGKIIGGGLPFASIAGTAKWMDALDGGYWRFGDESYPEAGVTYFAGTFVRHPLALAAAKAALEHLKECGPALQQELNARTKSMVARINAMFDACDAPIETICASSLWRTRVDADQPCASLFYYALRERGLHVYEQFNFFLSEAHETGVVDQIVQRIEDATRELMDAGVLTPRRRNPEQSGTAQRSSMPSSSTEAAQELPSKVPLTDAQMERWLAGHYNEDAILACNESTSSEFRGVLDVEALRKAVDFVAARHEVLAMRFAEDGSGQIWEPPCRVHMQQVDLSDEEDPEATWIRFSGEQALQPFDLAQPPLLRAHLLKLRDDHHVLLITAHHAVMDGWAWSVFSEELAAAYDAFHSGITPELPPADSWRRFVKLERARRDGPEGAECQDWWMRLYHDVPEPLNLPTDRPHGKVITFTGATTSVRFDTALTQALRAAARSHRVTLFSFLLTGFYALLHRMCGQDDLICGVPFAGQAINECKRVMGDSDNTLPIRVMVQGGESFTALVRRVHSALLDAAEHQDISLGRIVNALKHPHNTTGRLPLAEVLFNLNPIAPDIAYTGVDHRHSDLPKVRTNWDMAFHFNERDESLDLLLHYNSDLFDAATCQRWAVALRELLERATATPETTVADLPVMDSETRRIVLKDWNDTVVDYDRGQSLTSVIEAQMRESPGRIAAKCGDEALSYGDLDAATHAVAQALVRRGIGSGDLIGVCVPRSLQMLVAVLGVLRSGAAYVPLDPDFPTSRLEYMAGHARLHHVLVTRADVVPAQIASGRELLSVDNLAREAVDSTPLPEVVGSDLAYVLFTSGSTGQPKGVCILHRNLVNFLGSMREKPGFDANDVLCAVTTLSFDIAGLELYLPLITGGRLVIAPETVYRDPQSLSDLIEHHGCTVLQTTPSMLRLLGDMGKPTMLAGLRLFIGGEALPLELVRETAGRCRELWNLYGPTETTIWSSLARMRQDLDTVPLGRPIANTRIYVLDEHRQPVYPGVTGELWIGGDGVADGYLHRPDLTAERFVEDPYAGNGSRMYRTGDLGSWHDGELHFHGRVDHQIKIRGYRIEPGDIEAAAGSAPGVSECVALAHQFGDDDLRIVLYAAVEAAREVIPTNLREHLRQRLPAYMMPQHIELLDVLPKTPNGKIDRKALPTPVAAAEVQNAARHNTATSTGREEPGENFTDSRQEYLASIWRELIGVQDVRANDNFFDLGGHSLLAVEFAMRVQRERSVRLRLMDVATGTLASLAAELHTSTPGGTSGVQDTMLGRLRRLFAWR